MITFQKNKKNFLLNEKSIKKIKEDIEGLTKLPIGIYAKTKEFDFAYYVKITINKNNVCMDSTNKNYALLPDTITFLIVLDSSYPKEPPKIFCQTNVSLRNN
jgi:ubiquitin-protein ligase